MKEGKRVNIIVTTFKSYVTLKDIDCALLKELRENHLKNLVNENFSNSGEQKFIRFINFTQLTQELLPEVLSTEEKVFNTKLYGKS